MRHAFPLLFAVLLTGCQFPAEELHFTSHTTASNGAQVDVVKRCANGVCGLRVFYQLNSRRSKLFSDWSKHSPQLSEVHWTADGAEVLVCDALGDPIILHAFNQGQDSMRLKALPDGLKSTLRLRFQGRIPADVPAGDELRWACGADGSAAFRGVGAPVDMDDVPPAAVPSAH